MGRRLRRGATAAAVAAAALAALTASQAPGMVPGGAQDPGDSAPDAAPDGGDDDSITGDSPYYTDFPPLQSANPDPDRSPSDTESGIPATVLDAYRQAEAELSRTSPGCNLEWELLAAIGRVESGHARGGDVDADGTTRSPILGPVLNGDGFANISDTDGGAYDGDSSYDRAVGPMQFIPSTWATWGADANDDGSRDPDNVYDASLAAGRYLCAGGRDLSNKADLDQAILGYNHSQAYLRTVLSWYDFYKKGGAQPVPDGSGSTPGDRSDGSGGGGGGGGGTPSGSPSPSPSGTGSGGPGGTGGGPSPGPGSGDPGGGGNTSPSPNDPSPNDPSPPAPTASALKAASATTLSAFAGDEFSTRPKVRAVTSGGAGVAGTSVKFEIRGDTDARFASGGSSATVSSGSAGYATAPALRAQQTGQFTVRATVVGRSLTPVNFTATVKAPQADDLSRVGDAELTAPAGGEFAAAVEAKATYNGGVADGVDVTATMITSAEDPTQNDKGPFFKNADGETIRSLGGLETNADGVVKLPQIYAGGDTGTFLLRLTAAGGATLTLELNVT